MTTHRASLRVSPDSSGGEHWSWPLVGAGTDGQLPAQPGTHLQGEPALLLMPLAGRQHRGTIACSAPCLGPNVSLLGRTEGQLPWLSLFGALDETPAPGAGPGSEQGCVVERAELALS